MRIFELTVVLLEFLTKPFVELQIVFHRVKLKRLMAQSVVDVREPSDIAKFHKLSRRVIHAGRKISNRVLSYTEVSISARKTRTQPDFVVFQMRKDLFIRNSILIANNHKLLVCFHNPSQKLAEQ